MSNTQHANGTPLQIADVLNQIRPLTRSHPVCLRGDLRAEFDRAERTMGAALIALKAARERLDEVRAAVKRADDEDGPLGEVGADPADVERAVAVFNDCQTAYDIAEHALIDVQDEMRAATVEFKVKGYPGGNAGLMDLADEHRDPAKPLYVQETEPEFEPEIGDDGKPTGKDIPTGRMLPTGRAQLNDDGKPTQMIDYRGKPVLDLDDGYTPALWAACLVEPACDFDQAKALIGALNSDVTVGEITRLIREATREGLAVPTSLMLSPKTGASEQS